MLFLLHKPSFTFNLMQSVIFITCYCVITTWIGGGDVVVAADVDGIDDDDDDDDDDYDDDYDDDDDDDDDYDDDDDDNNNHENQNNKNKHNNKHNDNNNSKLHAFILRSCT